MDYNELLAKYHALQSENHYLREGNKRLRLQLGIPEQLGIPFDFAPNLSLPEQKLLPEMGKVAYNEEEIPNINDLSTLRKKLNYSCRFLKEGIKFMGEAIKHFSTCNFYAT